MVIVMIVIDSFVRDERKLRIIKQCLDRLPRGMVITKIKKFLRSQGMFLSIAWRR